MDKILTFVILVTIVIKDLCAHSWMSCPLSFVSFPNRAGHTSSLCENDGTSAFITEVAAGDRLKVGWPSNNHAGGFVRISLVKFGQHTSEEIAKNNVLKVACYGKDMDEPTKATRGDCDHPCNARGGCHYQSPNMYLFKVNNRNSRKRCETCSKLTIKTPEPGQRCSDELDFERYDTTVGIPTNLQEGLYVLQLAMLVGNGGAPYFSCAKLRITGGNTAFRCQSNELPILYNCFRSNSGRKLDDSDLYEGATRGDFCFFLNGTRGDVDSNIRDVPVNVECDPRVTCEQSVKQDQCRDEYPTMNLISNSRDPKQPYCKVHNTLAPLSPTCDDNIQNQDEEGVDCGGTACSHQPCPTRPPPVGDYFNSVRQTGNIWNSGGIVNIQITITKDMTEEQCWQMITQFNCPVTVRSTWNNVLLVNEPKNIVILEHGGEFRESLKTGKKRYASMEIYNPCFGSQNSQCMDCDDWNTELMQLNRFELDVKEASKCARVLPTHSTI